jgi:PIN domain nuclease of toxin-antitoxin system
MILLDTHTWLWLLHDPTQLSDRAITAITEAENNNSILISTISVWEIAVKHSLNKLYA